MTSEVTSNRGGGDCSAAELVLEGPYAVCPGQIIYVDLEEPNNIPPGGGQGIGFTNFDDFDFVISGMEFPYSFDSGINGILAENNLPPLEGDFLLYSVVFTNPNNVTGSICDDEWSIDVFFLSEDDPTCDQDPCFAQDLELIGSEEVCPGEATEVTTENPNTVPVDGGQGIRVSNNNDINLFIADVEFPFSFDNDLNGFLSENDLSPLEGNISFGSFVYTDEGDPENSICSQSGLQFSVNFLSSIHPDCIEGDCFAQDPVLSGPSAICPTQSTSVNLVNINTVPEEGGEGIRISDGADIDFIIPEIEFPFSFDGSLNGYLAENDINPLVGLFQMTSVVYGDSEDIQNSICSESSGSISVDFISGDLPECMICEAQLVFVPISNSICPGEVTTIYLLDPASIPTNGGQGLICTLGDGTEILLSEVTFPFELDNDLNGFLSTNDLDPFEEIVTFKHMVYTDPTDVENTICSEGAFGASINFLSPDDISCVSCEVQNLEILGPQFLCPDETTELDFASEITIPEGGGVGLNVYLSSFGNTFWLDNVSFPYTVDNDLNGLLSSNDLNPAQGWIQFRPFIYVDPSDPLNSICMMGEQTDINFLSPANSSCEEECIVEDLILTGPDEICEGETTSVDILPNSSIPQNGGFGIRFSNGEDINITTQGAGITFPFEIDNGLFENLTGDVLEGEFMITSFIYEDPLSINVPCSESDNPVFVTFLPEDDPACTLSMNEYIASGRWNLFPNPASDSFTIEIESKIASNASFQILDMQGRKIKNFSESLNPGLFRIQLSLNDVSPGLYQVVLNISGSTQSQLLMIK
ncbi:MAG TPA: T9SS type A sorting domain-containing protein [Cryomorphaceae bacterium]|nr:T9SS type A sorting domain-containing protein [Cryomorphaceae bacterium]